MSAGEAMVTPAPRQTRKRALKGTSPPPPSSLRLDSGAYAPLQHAHLRDEPSESARSAQSDDAGAFSAGRRATPHTLPRTASARDVASRRSERGGWSEQPQGAAHNRALVAAGGECAGMRRAQSYFTRTLVAPSPCGDVYGAVHAQLAGRLQLHQLDGRDLSSLEELLRDDPDSPLPPRELASDSALMHAPSFHGACLHEVCSTGSVNAAAWPSGLLRDALIAAALSPRRAASPCFDWPRRESLPAQCGGGAAQAPFAPPLPALPVRRSLMRSYELAPATLFKPSEGLSAGSHMGSGAWPDAQTAAADGRMVEPFQEFIGDASDGAGHDLWSSS